MNNGNLSKKIEEKERIKFNSFFFLVSLNVSTTFSSKLKDQRMENLRVGVCIYFRFKSLGYFLKLCRFSLSYMNSMFQIAVQHDYLITHPVWLGSN